MPRQPAVPPEFARQYDRERAVRLQHRALWYCIVVLSIAALGWGITAIDLLIPEAFPDSPDTSSADIVFNLIFTLLFAKALIYFARRQRSRAEIVRAFQWLIFLGGLAGTVVIAVLRHASIAEDAIAMHTPEDDLAQAMASLVTLFVLHLLSSMLVALSPREGLMPLVPVLGAFAAWVIFISAGSLEQKALLVLASPLAGLPGFAWSWWRYRSFNERFNTRAIKRRYAEVTRELAEARRVHEALFPPPISRGSIHLRYRYEPARQIGGDFLFVHPLAVAPAATEPPLSVVLIDVTGHGVAAALAVSRLNGELERLFAGAVQPAPGETLEALNRFTSINLAHQCIFATALCLRVFAGDEHRVEWASAGHPPAFLRSGGEVHTLESTAPMLGVLDEGLFDAAPRHLALRPGDVILAYTDGVIEASGRATTPFGIEGARRIVSQASPDNMADALMRAVEAHRAEPPDDDTLVVEIRPVDPAGADHHGRPADLREAPGGRAH